MLLVHVLKLFWLNSIIIDNNKDITLGSFYCSPNSQASTLDVLYTSICKIKFKFPASTIYLGGDFNYRGIDWVYSSLTDSLYNIISISLCERLVTISDDLFLNQVVTVPTRGPTNDISHNIHSQLWLFADNCLIYRTIQSSDDHFTLQDDLNTLTSWAKAFSMEFDTNKCKIIQVSTLCNNSIFTYTMSSAPLELVNHHFYLGVYLHQKLFWQPQVDYICSKANSILGFLWRNLWGSSRAL